MQHSPKREGPYALKRVAKKSQKEKAQKQSKVKRAVKEGCKFLHSSQAKPTQLPSDINRPAPTDPPLSQCIRKRLQSFQRRNPRRSISPPSSNRALTP